MRGWIIADTSAILALLDEDSEAHERIVTVWENNPNAWILPSVILPEVDYIARTQLGVKPARTFLNDVVAGAFTIEHSVPEDIRRAVELDRKYAKLNIVLVDGVVAAVAERLKAVAIVTLDPRHFSALDLSSSPAIYPRDLGRD